MDRLKELKVKFDKKISLKEFDKIIPKLVDNFSPEVSVLIKVRVKKNYIEVKLIKNTDKNVLKRWEWDLNDVAHNGLEDYFYTIN